MVGFTGVAFSSSAHAQRPTEGASIPTTAVTQDTNTVTTPCFRGAAGPTVAYEAPASECSTTYGAPYDSFGFKGGGGPSEGAKEAGIDGWMHHSVAPSEGAKEAGIDGWMHHPVDNVSGYEQFVVPPAETDGWAHHVEHIQVPGETDVATDGWAHHTDQGRVTARKPAVNFIEAPTSEASNWRNCFTAKSTYQAWMKAQVGMPKCGAGFEIHRPVNP
jgi:hypothetical protein